MSDRSSDEQDKDKPEKSASAFRTISEVADELDLPQHVLRFWETKFPQVRPMKRGGGRRYYRPDDMQLLMRIRDLLYVDGYTIKGVQKLLRHSGSVRNFVAETEARIPLGGNVQLSDEDTVPPSRKTEETSVTLEADLQKELSDIVSDLKGLHAQLLQTAG